MKFNSLKVLIFLLFLIIVFAGCNGNNNGTTGNTETLADTPGVGSIDQNMILTLKPFQDAEKDFAEQRKELVAEYSEMMEGLTDKQKEVIYRDYEEEISKLRFSLMTPLMDKEKEIIEKVAREEGLSVIVDETLVVCGIKDITDKVSKAFEAEMGTGDDKDSDKEDVKEEDKKDDSEKSDKKDETDKTQNPDKEKEEITVPQIVGFISKDQIYELPKMQKVQEKLYAEYLKMKQKVDKETKDLKDKDEIAKIVSDYEKKLKEKEDELFKPVEEEIDRTVEEIAREKSLIVVLEQKDIHYGGMDITSDVMDKLK